MFAGTISKVGENHWAQFWGVLLGIFFYLVEPGAAFGALWIAVAGDLFSRLIAEARTHGGLYHAAKEGFINSEKMFWQTAVKITAYFFMCVMANQSKYIFRYDAPSELFSTIVYSILFLVEFFSVSKNFQDAGVNSFKWLAMFAKQRLDKIVPGGGDICEGDKPSSSGPTD